MRSIFHMMIIAVCLLSLSGCGYKGNPYYEAPQKVR
ncbi:MULTISPECIES: LPS translocon maturation chaperone LptM [Sulfurimonas]